MVAPGSARATWLMTRCRASGVYRASIIAITDGRFLTLSTAQVHALAAQLGRCSPSAALSPRSGGRRVGNPAVSPALDHLEPSAAREGLLG